MLFWGDKNFFINDSYLFSELPPQSGTGYDSFDLKWKKKWFKKKSDQLFKSQQSSFRQYELVCIYGEIIENKYYFIV